DLDREGAEIRAPRAGMGRSRHAHRRRLRRREMATVTSQLAIDVQPPAARITLNRPERRNALSLTLMQELIAALEDVSATADVRAIVLAGAGPAFSAGHDLSEMIGREPVFYE